MISSAYRFIFLHAPKTGGNSVQSALLPFSDDAKVTDALQDGVNRFELRGPVTSRKHMTLAEYAAVLGAKLADYRTVLVLRNPLDRAMSMYYSPRRVARLGVAVDQFDLNDFRKIIDRMVTATEFVSLEGAPRMPDILLRFDRLEADFAHLVRALELPDIPLPRLNASADVRGLRHEIAKDARVISLVREKFAQDFAFFAQHLPGGSA